MADSRRRNANRRTGTPQSSGLSPSGGQATTLEDVGIDHGRLDVLVAQQFLDGTDVVMVFQQVGGEGVSEGVAGHALFQAGGTCRLPDGALQTTFVEVMAARLAGAWVL